MKIKKLFIDKGLLNLEDVQYLIARLKMDPEQVTSSREVFDYVSSTPDPVICGKETLYITKNHGAVLKDCPGTSVYTCCDYRILHTGTFCTMDCSYCILQAYFHPPVLQYFAGLDPIQDELEKAFQQKKISRIGTGEFTDSLIWEPVSMVPQFLVNSFSRQDSCVLELKTKTVNIQSLLDIDHQHKTILSWSLNTPSVIATEERKTTPLSGRLAAAKKAQENGFPVSFHFDPLVIYPGCKEEYEKVIEQLFTAVDPDNIVWISLGSFRFMPALKPIVEKRFSDSVICYGEFITGLDNKMRYFKPLRIDLYQHIISCIRSHAPDVLLYFCMEDEQIWNACLNYYPGDDGQLGHLLDRSAAKHCFLDQSLL